MPLSTVAEAAPTKWELLIFGSPGSGKTTLCGDIPNVLFICLDENGWRPLRRHPKAAEMQLFHTRSWSDLTKFIGQLRTSELIKTIDTIVVDTISECQVLERLKQIGGNPLTDEKWKFNEHIFTQNNFKIMALVRMLKSFGKNLVWLCHSTVEIVGEGKDGMKVIRPALSPTLLSSVQANVDAQWYLDKPGGNRVLSVNSVGEVQTKNRFKLSRDIANPTWADIQRILDT